MKTKQIKLYAYSVLVLACEPEPAGGVRPGAAPKEDTYRFRVIAHDSVEAEAIACELARATGDPRSMLATATKVQCLQYCHQVSMHTTT